MDIFGKRYLYRAEEDGDGGSSGGGATDAATAEPEIAQDVIDEASKMGWTPKEQFKGDPAKWRPADEFVERGKNMLPIVQATVKRQEREIADLKQSMKEFGEFHNKAEKAAYDSAMADLKAQRAEAIANGDGAAFDKIDDAIGDLKKDVERVEKKAAKNDDSSNDPEYVEWSDRNKSWLSDVKMEAFATAAAKELRESGEKSTGTKFLDMITKEVKEAFPHKFTNPRRETAASVEGGVPAQRRTGKDFASLPADARAACERMAKNAYSGDPKGAEEFKKNYVKQYYE